MAELKCPHCGQAFTVDDTELSSIVQQIRDKEFEKDIEKRISELKEHMMMTHRLEMEAKENEIKLMSQKEYDKEIQKLKSQLEKATDRAVQLQAQLDSSEDKKTIAVMEAVKKVEEEKKELESQLTHEKDKGKLLLEQKDEQIAYYRDLKTKMSTKMVGETLEQHCEIQFNQLRATAFRNAYFEKDNDSRSGSKGDYIYRETDEKGEIAGGPMYYIKNGMGKKYKWLGGLFAFFGVLVAYFGIGTFAQVNSIVDITKMTIGLDPVWTGAILTIFVAAITIGGLQSIAAAASRIVPAMAFIYFLSTIGVLLVFADKVPAAVSMIFESAFTTTAATGGFLGATVMMAMRNGVARGVFSNESGLGSAPIVAAAAKTKWPAEQGLISMTGTFIDTIIICTLTGLTLVVTGVWCGMENGAALTNAAFTSAFPVFGGYMLLIGLVLFAFTTILGWNYYGERCMIYLVGTKGVLPYRLVFILLIASGAFLKLEAIWILADIVNGLMAIPNLIALLFLSGICVRETKKYMDHLKTGKPYEEYED